MKSASWRHASATTPATIRWWRRSAATASSSREADDIFPAIERAFASGKPACVNVIMDQKPEGVTGGYEFLG